MKFSFITGYMLLLSWGFLLTFAVNAETSVEKYDIFDLCFNGPSMTKTDYPIRDIQLITRWVHESGQPQYTIFGFFDGDGSGGGEGNVFKIRFCPTKEGKWQLLEVNSNENKLNGQHQGLELVCIPSNNHGFWMIDMESQDERWYKRSDGSHPYIIGNTMYSFLSEMNQNGENGSTIVYDIQSNGDYFNKIRFSLFGDQYPHPTEKPFLDNRGLPTDDGNFSFRPNPSWFSNRVDKAVKTAFKMDIIADIILNGPDTEESSACLKAIENSNDAEPWLRYISARYGSFPNVWIYLANDATEKFIFTAPDSRAGLFLFKKK